MSRLARRSPNTLALSIGALAALLGVTSWWLFSTTRTPEAPETSARPLAIELNEQRELNAERTTLVAVKPAALETRSVSATSEPKAGQSAKLKDLLLDAGIGSPSTGNEETVAALAGRFVEYRGGVPSETNLNGAVDVQVEGRRSHHTVSVPLIDGTFELRLIHLDGRYRTLDGMKVLGSDPDKIRFRPMLPTSPFGGVFAYYETQNLDVLGRPELINFGTLDAVIPLHRTISIELAVIDEVTGMPLNHIEVYQGGRFRTEPIDPQSKSRERLQVDGSSPVHLEAKGKVFNASQQQLIVCAKGYAWDTITVDFTRPQQRQVALKRAGGLTVRLEGERVEDAKIKLRLESKLISERAASTRETVYEHLLPGVYAVSLEVGDLYSTPIVKASGMVEVLEGVLGELTLTVDPPESVGTGSVAGKLHIPVELGIDTPLLVVERLSPSRIGGRMRFRVTPSELKPAPEDPGSFTFQVDGLETGRYSIYLFESGPSDEFEVTPNAVASVELAVAPPVMIFASIEDELTGEDVPELTEMVWVPYSQSRNFSGHIKNVERDPETGRFEMYVAAMEIVVFAAGREFSQDVQRLVPVEGKEVRIRVSRRIPVLIELRDGENVVPWPIDVYPRPMPTEGKRRWTPSEFEAGRPRLEIPKAGTYRLEIPEINGYQTHPPIEFVVAPGAMQTVVAHLTPE